MHKYRPSKVLKQNEMQRLTLIYVQAYVNARHCQNRRNVLLALEHWQHTGAEMAEFIKTTRIVVIEENGTHAFINAKKHTTLLSLDRPTNPLPHTLRNQPETAL